MTYPPVTYPPIKKGWPEQLITGLDVQPLVDLLGSLPPGTPIAVDTETTGLYPYQSDVIRGVSIAFRVPSTAGMIEVGEPLDAKQVLALAAEWNDRKAGAPAILTEGASYRPFTHIVSFYIPVGYTEWGQSLSVPDQQAVFHALKAVDPFLIFHHGKFDFAFLRQLTTDRDGSVFFGWPTALADCTTCGGTGGVLCDSMTLYGIPGGEDWTCGGDAAGPCDMVGQRIAWWDTKVVAWLLDENMSTGLKEQAAFHFGEDAKDEQKAIKKLVKEKGWDGLTPADTAQYAAKDAELTLRLYELQQQLVDGHGGVVGPAVRPAIVRELAKQAALSRMERTGILVDADLIEKMRGEATEAVDNLEAYFDGLGVNIRSPKQLGEYLYDTLGLECKNKTATGARSVNREALEALPETPDTLKLLAHRRMSKALSGYLTPLGRLIGADGRVHPTFWSMGTVTGRLSCSDPNLQTIPRGDTLKGVRDVFIPEAGFDLWSYDLAAAEMRVMAGMAGDEELMANLLRDDWDPHSELAATVFGPDFTGLQRRYAKNLRYGWQYGLTSLKTAAKYISGSNAEQVAEKILAGLKKLHPKIVALMNSTTKAAEKDGWVSIGSAWPGRSRRFVTQSPRRPQSYQALNSQVQGSIGEYMMDVLMEAEDPLARVGARICLQVHDALVVEVPEGTGPQIGALLQEIADKLNPFVMPMAFTAEPWSAHD